MGRVVGGRSQNGAQRAAPRTDFVDRQHNVCIEISVVSITVTASGDEETGQDLFQYPETLQSVDIFQASFKESQYLNRPSYHQPRLLEFLLSFGHSSLQVDAIKKTYDGFQDVYIYNGINPNTLQPIRVSDQSLGSNLQVSDMLNNFPRSRGIWQVKIAIDVWEYIKAKKGKGRAKGKTRGKTQLNREPSMQPVTVYDQKRKERDDLSDTSLPSLSISGSFSALQGRNGHAGKRRRLHSRTPSDHQISPLSQKAEIRAMDGTNNNNHAAVSPSPQLALGEIPPHKAANLGIDLTAEDTTESNEAVAETIEDSTLSSKIVAADWEMPARVTRARAREVRD